MKTKSHSVSLVSKRQVLHPGVSDQGPRITEVQTISTPAGLVEVDIWTENGRVVKVGEPRRI